MDFVLRDLLDQFVVQLSEWSIPLGYLKEEYFGAGESFCKAEPSRLDSPFFGGLGHCDSGEGYQNEFTQQFLVERVDALTMPDIAFHLTLEVPVKRFYVPALMVHFGQFVSRKLNRIEQGSHKPPAAESFAIDINHSDSQRDGFSLFSFMGSARDFTEIIPRSKFLYYIWPTSGIHRYKKVALSVKDFVKQANSVEAIVEQDEGVLLDLVNQRSEEFELACRRLFDFP